MKKVEWPMGLFDTSEIPELQEELTKLATRSSLVKPGIGKPYFEISQSDIARLSRYNGRVYGNLQLNLKNDDYTLASIHLRLQPFECECGKHLHTFIYARDRKEIFEMVFHVDSGVIIPDPYWINCKTRAQ